MLFLLTPLSTFFKHLRVSGILSTRCDPRVLGAYKTESPNYNEQKPRMGQGLKSILEEA